MGEEPNYEVYWSEQAVRDLEAIVAFIARDAPDNAKRVLNRLRERAADLHHLAERGRPIPELATFGIVGLRELVVRPYRVVYRFDSRRVVVLAVFDGRRDLGEVLFERLMRS